MIHVGGISGQIVVQRLVVSHLQDGSLFGLEDSSDGDDAGLLRILLDCCFTTRIQIKLVVMGVSIFL